MDETFDLPVHVVLMGVQTDCVGMMVEAFDL